MCVHCICPEMAGGHMGVGGPGTKLLSELQNGRPAVTARSSDHEWTSHNE